MKTDAPLNRLLQSPESNVFYPQDMANSAVVISGSTTRSKNIKCAASLGDGCQSRSNSWSQLSANDVRRYRGPQFNHRYPRKHRSPSWLLTAFQTVHPIVQGADCAKGKPKQSGGPLLYFERLCEPLDQEYALYFILKGTASTCGFYSTHSLWNVYPGDTTRQFPHSYPLLYISSSSLSLVS